MDAHKLWMLRDFIGTNKVLFRIPVYQRNYDWSEGNCNRLLEDIRVIMETGEKHFIGTIVFMAAKSGGFTLQEYVIIDGQQRLTTLMLMLKALSVVAEQTGDDCYHEIEEQYLHNKYCDEAYKIKLKPIKSDNEQFLLLLSGKSDEMDEDSHIYRNFTLCKTCFERWNARGFTPSQVLDAMTKLEIVEIVLTKGEDDPQVIFESINSTGLELSNADLIRNFLLMNADEQERLYEDYWMRIEKTLRNKTDYSNLDAFFTHYITYKTSRPVSSRYLYNSFVKLFKDNQSTQEEMLKELKYCAEIFGAFVNGSKAYSENINRLLKGLRVMNQTTCYPFLLHIFDDYHHNAIDEATLEKILHFILTYLLRRMVCGIPSNTLRGLFTYLYNRVYKVTANKKKYYEALNKFLFTLSSKDAIPSLSEFERALRRGNLYSNIPLCRFLLFDIENGNGKEVLQAENLTIEHIMPQTLSADWNYITPEQHEEYLHTLGNLSVTGYNSELSNKSFQEKKALIRENSKAVTLNSDVLDKDVWNIDCIRARARRLSKIVLSHYKIEPVHDDSIAFEYIDTLTFDDCEQVTGKRLLSFTLYGETYPQNKFVLMLMDVIRLLNKKQPQRMAELAKSDYCYTAGTRKHSHLNTNGDGMRKAAKIADDLYIEVNLSAKSCVWFIEKLMEDLGLDKNQFSLNVMVEDTSGDTEDS